jgi:DNA-directed RNA polymerase specialized sigma24 family protein
MSPETNEPLSNEIVQKLDQLIALSAFQLVIGKPQRQQIALLDAAGLPPKAIAELLATTRNTVSVALHDIRKAKERPLRMSTADERSRNAGIGKAAD